MPTATYIALANLTLSSSASDVTFSSIPTTGYRDLVLVIQATTLGSTETRLTVNSDTGNNYNYVRMYGAGSAGSDSQTNLNRIDLANNNTSSGYLSITQFLDYSATDKHKPILIRSQEGGLGAVLAVAARWASTSAISTIRIQPPSFNFASGSTFALYGIVS